MNVKITLTRKQRDLILEISRDLRKKQTRSEEILWQFLRNKKLAGKKFKRQHPIGSFVVDFYCASEKLVIEIDGKVHEYKAQKEYDKQRQEILEALDLRFFRLSAELVENNVSQVLKLIESNFTPNPLPKLGEGKLEQRESGER